MKLRHPTLKSMKSVSSKGAFEVDANGFTEVSEELGAHLIKVGFQLVVEKPLFPVELKPPEKKMTPAVLVPPAPAFEPPAVLTDGEVVDQLKKNDRFLADEVTPIVAVEPKATPSMSPARTEKAARMDKLKDSHAKTKKK